MTCAVFTLGLFSGACTGPKSPPKLPVMATAPVVLPVPAVPADEMMFGYLHVRDPLALVGKLAQLGGISTEQLVAQRGIKLGELKTGAPLVGFLWDPQGATAMDVPAVVLAPVPADGALVGTLMSASPAVHTATVGQNPAFTALYLGPTGQARLSSGGPGLLALAQAKQPFDLTLYVNATPIMAKYGPILHSGIKTLGPVFAMSAAKNPAGPSPQSMLTMLDQLVSGLDDLKTFTLGATVTTTALELSTLTAPKQGDSSGPIAAPDLAQFVPPGDMRLQWNTRDVKRMIDWYMRVYGGFLDEKPELRAQVVGLIDAWLKAGRRMQTAMSLSYTSGQGLAVSGILKVEDGPAAMAAIRRSAKLFSDGPVRDAYKNMGIDFAITHVQDARKVRGYPVDRVSYSFKLDANKQQGTASMKNLFDQLSGLTYEVAQVGPYLVYSLGTPVDATVDALLLGRGRYPMAAMQTFPAGGSLYVEVDISHVLQWFSGLVPVGQKNPIPVLPGTGNVVSVWSYDGGPVSYQKVVIPTQLIQNVVAATR